MFLLNRAAFDILKAEIERRCANHPAGQIQQEMALKRLEKLCTRTGTPLTLPQLHNTLDDLFPDFSKAVLKQAAKANQPPSPVLGRLTFAAIALAGLAGSVWFLNLPYPMIRYPVARTIPFVLLPSFMSMDHNYRQAIALTEQADQLVNRATAAADFDLGKTKVESAQKHLDALPVWFLGYYPSAYCGWFRCSWRFTLDEFQQARKSVARMDARLFQEKNALVTLGDAETAIAQAKAQYQQQSDPTKQQGAIAQWQQAMDELETVSQDTLGGRTAQTKLIAFKRDFEDVVGFEADNARSGSIIQAAKMAAETAKKFSTKPTQTVVEWQAAKELWEEPMTQLRTIKVEDPDYLKAQELLQIYQQNLRLVEIRLQQEKDSVRSLEAAQQRTQTLLAMAPDHAKTMTNDQRSQLFAIINELKKVSPRTTVYSDAQTMLQAAQKRLAK
jgi:hypothetical protein